jgi:nucleotide-binding universal stress UspA family protein
MSTTTVPHLDPHPTLLTGGTPERIVLGTDGSAARFAVARWVADRATRHAVAARVVTVVRSDEAVRRRSSRRLIGRGVAWEIREYLSGLEPKTAITVAVLEGDRERVLLDAAAEADLLVLGTERRADSTPIGPSFSTRLAERAPCPVVVVPQGWSPRLGAVVVGVAPDSSDRRAREFAVAEAQRTARPLLVVHGWHLPWLLHPIAAAGIEDALLAADQQHWLGSVADGIAGTHPELHVAAVFSRRPGAAALLEAGRDASLVVLGAHRLDVLDRLVLGSVGRLAPRSSALTPGSERWNDAHRGGRLGPSRARSLAWLRDRPVVLRHRRPGLHPAELPAVRR